MLKKAISISPQLISPYYTLGTLLLYQNRFEEGYFYLSKGISLDPNYLDKHKSFVTNFSSPAFGSAEIYFSFAKLYASIGNIEKTLEYLKKAKKAGFRNWHRIKEDKDFEKIINNPKIKAFIQNLK